VKFHDDLHRQSSTPLPASSIESTPLNVECSPLAAGCSLWPTTLTTLLDWKIEEDPIDCTLAPEAATLLRAYETELRTTPDPDFGLHHHFADHAYRLTLLLHLADHAGYVAAEETEL